MSKIRRFIRRERDGLIVGGGVGFALGALALAALVRLSGITILGG